MPVKYIPYYPDTVEGQAILNNFVRTHRALKYWDNNKVYYKIEKGMPYYELEKVESVGDNPKNMVIRGECISACAYLKEQGIYVDLVYIDPPFASGADYAKKIYIRRNPKVADAIKKSEETLDINELQAFEEKMYGDIWNKEAYLNWLYENLFAIKSIMTPTASIYVHLDWHIGNYAKVLMDEVFGEDNFHNEIIWKRKGGSSNPSEQYDVATDHIFWYSIGEEMVFNQTYVKDTPEVQKYIKERFTNKDKDGRVYMTSPIVSPNYRENLVYDYKGYTAPPNGWSIEIDVMKKWDKEGKLYFPKKGNRIYRKIYLDEYKGQPISNLWTDIFVINPVAKERLDYSTQKPESLLTRIVYGHSKEFRDERTKERMIIADFFGGSGVTAKVAHDLRRNFIHVDVGINSIQTTRDRLVSAGVEFDILEIKDGVNLFRNPVQTMDKLAKLIPGLQQKINGLSKYWFGSISDSKLGTIPVYVPDLTDHTQKVLDIPIINRIVNQELPALENVQKTVVNYIDMDDEKAILKFIKDNNMSEIAIELRDLKQLLAETVVDDYAEYNLTENKGEFIIELTQFISDRLRQKIDEYNQKGQLQPLNEVNEDENEKKSKKKKKKFVPIEISNVGLELIEFISLDCTNTEGLWHSDREIKIDKLGYIVEDGKKTKNFWAAKIISKKKPLRMKIRNIAGDEVIIDLTGQKEKTKKEVKEY
ncbi:MAG: site-specific DNA-methyltransferase [Candidatus Marinimicrobia bacterium]|nr:site-specific DNA-methyltransferase [Candidatus Neomarinimicrobiota bacterium]